MKHSTAFKHSRVLQHVERQALKGIDPNNRNKRRQLIKLAVRDGKYCVYCKRPVKFAWEPGMGPTRHNAATFEHRKTKSTGGMRHLNNGDLACYLCNNYRGDASISVFLARLEAAGGDPLELQRRAKAKKRAKRALRYELLCRRNTLQCLSLMDNIQALDAFITQSRVMLTSWSHSLIMG